jgi:hypothetical protein
MAPVRQLGASALLLLLLAACRADAETAGAPAAAHGSPATRADSSREGDSIPDERPDSVRSTAADSLTMVRELLPAPPGGALAADAAALAERAVFVPRTQRWFLARVLDSTLVMDIGRIDGGVGTTDAARAAFQQMVTAHSPVPVGGAFSLHRPNGPVLVRVAAFRLRGRRILAELSGTVADSTEPALAVEWPGRVAQGERLPERAVSCPPGDSAAINAAMAKFVAAPNEAVSVIRGCFGDFRALLTIRPLEVTPESIERVILVRANGGTRSGRLRDLSYPLHELRGVTNVDGNNTHEIIVRSVRPAMETWAALRMTDSITFTRFASGFTIEQR